MLRAVDLVLTLAPLVFAALLYGIWFRHLPGRRVVVGLCVAEAVLAAVLVWQSTADGLRPHERYVPAKLQGDTVEEGHGG